MTDAEIKRWVENEKTYGGCSTLIIVICGLLGLFIALNDIKKLEKRVVELEQRQVKQ